MLKKLILIIVLIGLGYLYINNRTVIIKKEYYPVTEKTSVSIENYNIYGRSLNIEGTLKKQLNKNIIKNISLVLNKEKGDTNVKITYNILDDRIEFKTSDKLNTGIILDNIATGDYFLLLKIAYNDESIEYYSVKNNTDFGNLDYYSTTKNGRNKYITMNYINPILKSNKLSYFKIKVINKTLPKKYYDIVIDPGHGGIDSGAVNGDVHEAAAVLDIAAMLKEQLQDLGLKVMLTREGNYNPGGTWKDAYYEEGRVNIPGNVKAKYMFSIHLNSAPYKMKKGGVEIYSPSNIDYSLATLLADNIVETAKTTYSPNGLYKIANGVYNRNFTAEEIKDSDKDANDKGYKPYNISLDTPYHYIVREPGGLMTKAYVDGRNPKYHSNLYYNSNIGVESYLVELGYMVNDADLANLLNNKIGYVLAVKKTLKNFLLDEL